MLREATNRSDKREQNMNKFVLITLLLAASVASCDSARDESTEVPEAASHAATIKQEDSKGPPTTEAATPESSRELGEDESAFMIELRHDTSHITPGDRVDVMWTTPESDSLLSRPKGHTTPSITFAMLHDVRVIGSFDRALELAVTPDEVRLLAAASHHAPSRSAFDAYSRVEDDREIIAEAKLSSERVFDLTTIISTPRCIKGKPCKTRFGLSAFDAPVFIKHLAKYPLTFERGTRLVTMDSLNAHARFEAGQEIGLVFTWEEGNRSDGGNKHTKTHVIFHRLTVHSTAKDSITFPVDMDQTLYLSSLRSMGHLDVIRGEVKNPFAPATLKDLVSTLRDKRRAHEDRVREELYGQ